MKEQNQKKGFTLIEVLLVIAVGGMISVFIFLALDGEKTKQRDIRRVAEIADMQKALALHSSEAGGYPEFNGCVDGTDPVSLALDESGVTDSNADFRDPTTPSDVVGCYLYQGTAGSYRIRFVLERDSVAGNKGAHIVVP